MTQEGTTYPNIEILYDLAIASNGLHTNGYSLVRLLMKKMPQIKLDKINGFTFIEQILGNLDRVILNGLCAKIVFEKRINWL